MSLIILVEYGMWNHSMNIQCAILLLTTMRLLVNGNDDNRK